MNDVERSAERDEEEAALRRLILRQADEADAATVVERVVPRLARAVRGQFPSLSADDAADLAREALTVALERADAFVPERPAGASGWLYGIARLRTADHFRKRGSDQPLPSEDDATLVAPAAPADDAEPELSAPVREAIERLPPQQRRAVEAHYLDGRAPRDVDAAFGWRPNTANVYLANARRSLRLRLADVQSGGQRPMAIAGGCRSRARLHMRARVRLQLGLALAA